MPVRAAGRAFLLLFMDFHPEIGYNRRNLCFVRVAAGAGSDLAGVKAAAGRIFADV